MRKKVSAR